MSRDKDFRRLNIIDVAWFTQLAAALGQEAKSHLTLTVAHAKEQLEAARIAMGMGEAEASFALIPTDPRKAEDTTSAIFGLMEALRAQGIRPSPVDYRHTYRSIPPSLAKTHRTPADEFQQMSGLINYMIGMVANRSSEAVPAEILVVTGSFDCYLALRHFVEKRSGKAGIAWFDGHLDGRWFRTAGLNRVDSLFKFFDLDKDSWFVAREPRESADAGIFEGIGDL